ncbi:MAG: exodeoxyribonuclease V subunit beta, partial [Deltaproteobacteria bacterium]|nr:exodeoxyribonuclease V subunit beta [Deltaproteobacteria bacterium]
VAAEISRLLALGRQEQALIDEKRVEEKDIAVLVRTNNEAGLVQQALGEVKVHSVLYNIGNLFSTPEAMDIQYILAAVVDPADEKALKAALVTDLLGVGGEELERLMGDETAWEGWLIRIGEYHDTWARFGFFKMIREMLSREGVLPRIAPWPDGERRAVNVLHLTEVLHQTALDKQLDMYGLLKWLSAQRADSSSQLEEHQLRLESDENAVKIVTIHKSKGLEYPIVFCPFLWAGSKVKDRDKLVFHDESNELSRTIDLGSPDWDRHQALTEQENLAENIRLVYVAMTRAKHRLYLIWGRFNRAGDTAPAYLFHPEVAQAGNGQPGLMAEEFKKLGDPDLWRDLMDIQDRSNGSIKVSELPNMTEDSPPAPAGQADELTCRDFKGKINRNRRMASFSSLVSSQPHRVELADRDETIHPGPAPAAAGRELPLDKPEQDMFAFPKGAASGILLHEIFEDVDFALPDEAAAKELINRKLADHGFNECWKDPIYSLVKNTLTTSLNSDFGDFCLAQVPAAERLNELEFYFPLQKLTERDLKNVFVHQVGAASASTLPSRLERLDFRPLEGFMKGFIDLVFRFNNRFYIVDWKSNHLGGKTLDYNSDALQRVMNDNVYKLQYYLYTVAVDQYLNLRIPNYSYATHFGEVYYLFIRGIDPTYGPAYGVYKNRPPQGAIETLSTTLIGRK